MFENKTNIDFENLNFNPFSEQESILLNSNFDPDNNFFDENIFHNINASYLSEEEVKIKLSTQSNNAPFSILHLNIRSMTKKFENFKLFLSRCAYDFSMICLSETWNSDESFSNDSTLHLPNYNPIHFGRKNKRGGGICVFVNERFIFKRRDDLWCQTIQTKLFQLK